MQYGFVIAGFVIILLAYVMPHAALLSNATIPSNLTAAINSTAAYISRVNQSAYVAFYPNLTDSYLYLSDAKSNASSGNYANAYALLSMAKNSAYDQLQRINAYRYATLVALAVLLIALLLILRHVMKPLRNRGKMRR